MKPNVILLSLDSLRADHLPIYGYERNTAPALLNFANRSDVTVFENCFAPTAWTLPSHTSLFTGLSTDKHGVYDQGYWIDPNITLPSFLNNAGYESAAFLNNGWLTEAGVTDSFDKRFDIFRMDEPDGHFGRQINRLKMLLSRKDSGGDETIESFSQWFDRVDHPFFAFLHLMEPHYLYNPSSPYHKQYTRQCVTKLLLKQKRIYTDRGKYFAGETSLSKADLQGFRNLYDGEIRYLDERLNELIELLQSENAFSDSLIIVFGDHGEHFGEHGLIGHHFSLSDELLHVPLLVKWPDCFEKIDAQNTDAFVSLLDVFGTVLKVVGQRKALNWSPSSLGEKHNENHRIAFAHYKAPDSMIESFHNQVNDPSSIDDYDHNVTMVRKDDLKLVQADSGVRLYKLDPKSHQYRDVSDENPSKLAELQELLEKKKAKKTVSKRNENGFDEDVKSQLEDLGYI